MLELCMSGQALRIFLRSSLAQIMKAFMGRLMWGASFFSRRDWRIILAPIALVDDDPIGGEQQAEFDP